MFYCRDWSTITEQLNLAVDLTCLSEDWAGYQYYAANLSRALVRSSASKITLFFTGDRDNLPGELQSSCRCLRLPEPANSRVLTEQVFLPLNLPSEIDRLLVPAYLGPLFTSVPTDLIVYDLAFLKKFSGLNFKQKLYWRGLYRSVFRKAGNIFPCSSTTARRFRKRFPELTDKLGPVLYPGLKRRFTGPPELAVDSDRAELKPYILFVGTISPRKNVDRLLDWYLSRTDINKRYNLVLVGKYGWGDIDPESLTQSRNGVHWFRDVDDSNLLGFYRNARTLVLPSQEEGFGMPLLEAFSQSLPVVVTDTPVFREVAGEAAFYLNSASTTGWTATFRRALENDRERKIKTVKGQRRLKQFTWSASARKYLRTVH